MGMKGNTLSLFKRKFQCVDNGGWVSNSMKVTDGVPQDLFFNEYKFFNNLFLYICMAISLIYFFAEKLNTLLIKLEIEKNYIS